MNPPPDTPSRRLLASWLRGLLASHGLRPRKSLGQVFLVDPRGIRAYASAVEDAARGRLAEVGSGPGHLSYYINRVYPVSLAVEVDRGLARLAGLVLRGTPTSVALLDGVALAGWGGYETIVSNTPYNISAPLIAAASRNNRAETLILGLQAEVADRVSAIPGTPEYGRLTLLVNRYWRVRVVARLPRSWYWPVPDVHGVLVVFERVREWRPGDEEFEALTACLFSARNKLADKIASKCTGVPRSVFSRRLAGKRVRDLTVGDVEWIMEAGRRGST